MFWYEQIIFEILAEKNNNESQRNQINDIIINTISKLKDMVVNPIDSEEEDEEFINLGLIFGLLQFIHHNAQLDPVQFKRLFIGATILYCKSAIDTYPLYNIDFANILNIRLKSLNLYEREAFKHLNYSVNIDMALIAGLFQRHASELSRKEFRKFTEERIVAEDAHSLINEVSPPARSPNQHLSGSGSACGFFKKPAFYLASGGVATVLCTAGWALLISGTTCFGMPHYAAALVLTGLLFISIALLMRGFGEICSRMDNDNLLAEEQEPSDNYTLV